eukprot:13821199-Ditylum_brightwellii.AAC.1
MSAVDDSMKDISMRCHNAVTTVQNSTGQIHLLEIKRGVYWPSLVDNKAVINTHFICEARWQVDEVATHHRGSQCVWFPNRNKLRLEYDATKHRMLFSVDNPHHWRSRKSQSSGLSVIQKTYRLMIAPNMSGVSQFNIQDRPLLICHIKRKILH